MNSGTLKKFLLTLENPEKSLNFFLKNRWSPSIKLFKKIIALRKKGLN